MTERELEAESARLRADIDKFFVDVTAMHLALNHQRCELMAEIEQLRVLNSNLAHQCRVILDYWPEFQADMSLPVGKQVWRKTTEKYLTELTVTT